MEASCFLQGVFFLRRNISTGYHETVSKGDNSMKNNTNNSEVKSQPKPLSTTPIGLGTLISTLPRLDTNPPYQRGEVWGKSYRAELLHSIFDGIPINTMHWVEKGNGSYWVLDGKQRIDTLKLFTQGKLSIKRHINGKEEEIKWDNINNPEHPAHCLLPCLEHYQVSVVRWGKMPFEDQKKIFNKINYSKELNAAERIYCDYYLTKLLLDFIRKDAFQEIMEHTRGSRKNNKRLEVSRMIHQIFILCFGTSFDEEYGIKSLGKVNIQKSAEKIEFRLQSAGFNASRNFEEDQEKWIKSLGIEKNYKEIKKIIRNLTYAFEHPNAKSKNLDINIILDLIFLFYVKCSEKIMTTSYMESNLNEIASIACEWIEKKNKDKSLKSHSTTKQVIEGRIKELSIIFDKHISDKGIKNRALSPDAKSIAAMKSPANCPVTGIKMTDNNSQFDHRNPKSISSDSDCILLSTPANRKKSNITNNECQILTQNIFEANNC
jgi:hypothetical protein